nr:hypothetical protein [Ruminococcus bromii]
MIDCSNTKAYFAEKARMSKTTKSGICKVECAKCPLSSDNNGVGECCADFEMLYPQAAISIVQRWSNANPQRTYLTELLKHYPNAELNHGVPKVCLKKLGAVSGCVKTKKGDLHISCYSCWNQPIPIEDGEE